MSLRRPEVLGPELVEPRGYEPGNLVYSPPPGAPSPSGGSTGRRRVLVARKIVPGQSLQLESSPEHRASFPKLCAPETEAQSVLRVSESAARPRRGVLGLLPHTLIGSAHDYSSQEPQQGAPTSSVEVGAPLPSPYASASRQDDSGKRFSAQVGAAGLWETIGEATAAEELGLSRAEEAHEHTARNWHRTKRALAQHTGRPESELVMTRADRWRHVTAEARLVEGHRSLNAQYGESSWAHGLRGANEHYVPLGNNLSGLYLAVRRAPPVPLDRAHPEFSRKREEAHRAAGGHGAPLPELRTHGGTMTGNEQEGSPEGSPKAPPRTAPPQTAVSACDVSYFEQSRLVEGSAVPVDMAESRPALELSHTRLLFEAAPGDAAVNASTRVKNTGTTALAFSWHPQLASLDGVPGLEGAGAGNDGQPRFFSFSMSGVLLPGQEKDLRLCFSSTTAGAFTERWVLATDPPLPEGFSIALELRGLCAERAGLATERQLLRQRMSAAEVHGFVRDLVIYALAEPAAELGAARALAKPLALAPPPRTPPPDRRGVASAFESANQEARLQFEPGMC
mmetsp:Transcript_27287/g.68905  ORF Transcript_27287/g.68905 Transcript_27287/m.68905 type:complete len:566 (+) Transcript_27287:89-1786(+)